MKRKKESPFNHECAGADDTDFGLVVRVSDVKRTVRGGRSIPQQAALQEKTLRKDRRWLCVVGDIPRKQLLDAQSHLPQDMASLRNAREKAVWRPPPGEWATRAVARIPLIEVSGVSKHPSLAYRRQYGLMPEFQHL